MFYRITVEFSNVCMYSLH